MTSTQSPIAVPPPPLPPVPNRKRRGPIVAAILAGAFVVGGLAGSAVWAATHNDANAAAAAGVRYEDDTTYDDHTTSDDHTTYEDGTPYDGDTTSDDDDTTSGWSAIDERAVLNTIESHPIFSPYDPYCVLAVIQDHFDSLDEFSLAAETDSYAITSSAYDVVDQCRVADSY